MRIIELHYLLQIAQYQSISLAAQNLAISQQQLSRIVQSVEKEIGFAIFSRSKKGVALTKEGITFTKYAQRILTLYEDMLMIQQRPCPTVDIIFGIDKHINAFFLQKLLNVFQEHPLINFSLQQKNSVFELIDALIKQNMHMALGISLESTTLNYLYNKSFPHTLQHHIIASEQIYAIVHKNNPCALKKTIQIEELLLYPMVFCTFDSTYNYLIQNPLGAKIDVFLETDNLAMQLSCINNNFAVGLIDGFSLPYLIDSYPNIRAIPFVPYSSVIFSLYTNLESDFLPLQQLKKDILQSFT